MKVSLNWVRFINQKYGCAGDPAAGGADKLIEKIGAQLGAVEEVVDLGKKYQGATVAKVLSCEKHPNADKLSICKIDVGKERPVQVVCGAPNVAAGQSVVWLPPGATVPSTFDKDPFVLEAREIRGVTSQGMLASAKELALGDDHSGILVLDGAQKPGASFAKVYDLDDTVIDVENKMFTHRPDLFGQLGIARELAAIQHQTFKSPSWYREDTNLPNDGRKNVLKLAVKNELPKLVPRFTAVAIKDIRVEQSPLWLKVRLASVGLRPINNIVDITNFYMLETAQPLHAYDYDKLAKSQKPKAKSEAVLGVRLSKRGETLRLLGGKEIKLSDGAVVITDGDKPIGLGGIMGGADTEVDENTTSIVLECANFDMNTTRRTAMEHGLFTDAATRFTKGQSPLQTRAVLVKAVEDVKRVAGGRVASEIVDDFEPKAKSQKPKAVEISPEFVNQRLGLNLAAEEIKKLLENVEFEVKVFEDRLEVTAPFWRTDIEIAEDVVEEVGRLYGYNKLPVVLPRRDLTPPRRDQLLDFKSKVRGALSEAGANEVLTYSFVHGNLINKTAQDKAKAYKLANALSPDSEYYRLSLTPSLLDKVHPNQKLGFGEFALFEINKVHVKPYKDEIDKELPKEFEMLALVFASSKKSLKQNGSVLYEVRLYLDYLASELGAALDYRSLSKDNNSQVVQPFEPNRSAEVWDAAHKVAIGIVGEYKQSVASALKLPKFCAGFEVDIKQLIKVASPQKVYIPLNRFPSLEQDFCLRASVKLSYAELTAFMIGQLQQANAEYGYNYDLSPLDIFQRHGEPNYKQTTWRIWLSHPEKTLTTKEANKLLDKIAAEAKKQLNAERI